MNFPRLALLSIAIIIVFTYFIIARFPAAHGLALASKFSGGSLLYQQASGTIWQGQAEQIVVSTPQQLFDLGHAQWQLHAWPLLTAKLKMTFEAKKAQQLIKAKAVVSRSRLKLEDVELRVALQELMVFSPMPLPLTVEGGLQLDLQTVELSKNGIDAISGNAVVQNVLLKMHEDIALGSYGAKLSKEGEEVVANVMDIDGTVELSGVMKANLNSRSYDHDVSLRVKDNAHAMINQALSMVANKQNDGRYHLKQSGQF